MVSDHPHFFDSGWGTRRSIRAEPQTLCLFVGLFSLHHFSASPKTLSGKPLYGIGPASSPLVILFMHFQLVILFVHFPLVILFMHLQELADSDMHGSMRIDTHHQSTQLIPLIQFHPHGCQHPHCNGVLWAECSHWKHHPKHCWGQKSPPPWWTRTLYYIETWGSIWNEAMIFGKKVNLYHTVLGSVVTWKHQPLCH